MLTMGLGLGQFFYQIYIAMDMKITCWNATIAPVVLKVVHIAMMLAFFVNVSKLTAIVELCLFLNLSTQRISNYLF